MNQAILAKFSPVEQDLLRERLSRFGTLSRFVGGDFQMPVELSPAGAGWHWNFANNTVAFDAQELLDFSDGAVRAIAVHEGAHRRILVPQCLPADLAAEPGFMFMTNAVEDCRGNNFALAYYPAFADDVVDLYEKTVHWNARLSQEAEKVLGFAPRHIQAGLEYIRGWYCNSRGLKYEMPLRIAPEVRRCLTLTLPAVQRSARYFPSMEECELEPGRVESYCRASMDIIVREIWPEFRQLVALDIQDGAVQSMLREMFGKGAGAASRSRQEELRGKLSEAERRELDKAIMSGKQGAPAGGGPDFNLPLDSVSRGLKQKLRDFLQGLPRAEKEVHEENAKRALEGICREFIDLEQDAEDKRSQDDKPSQSGPPATSVPAAGSLEPLLNPPPETVFSSEIGLQQDRYEEYKHEMKSLIVRLKSGLEAALSANEPGRFEEGLQSGTSLNLPRRVREIGQHVSPCNSRAFRRRCEQEEKDYAFFLLIDLSGSMCGSKLEEAAKAAVLFCEVLQALDLPFGVAGYHSSYFSLKDLSQPLEPQSQRRIGAMEALAGGSTDTGWAVETAMQALMRNEAAQKVMIVLTDGAEAPSAAHADPKQLLPAVLNRMRRLYANEAPIMVGIGVGAGTAEVARSFPNHLAEIDAAALPRRFCKLLGDVIVRGEVYQ